MTVVLVIGIKTGLAGSAGMAHFRRRLLAARAVCLLLAEATCVGIERPSALESRTCRLRRLCVESQLTQHSV